MYIVLDVKSLVHLKYVKKDVMALCNVTVSGGPEECSSSSRRLRE